MSLWPLQKCHFLVFTPIWAALALGPICAFCEVQSLKHPCDEAISSTEELNVTDRFISYLAVLYNQNLITIDDFKNMLNHLTDHQELISPIASADSQTKAFYHVENLQQYLSQKNLMNLQQVQKWLGQVVGQEQDIKIAKEQTSEATKSSMHKIEFHELNGVAIMDVLVPQWLWIEVMGKNPSYKKMGGDFPVESVTWWSILEFANRLSIRDGFDPVYDLSNIKFLPNTYAEDGTLASYSDEPKANIQKINGYRLPTREEDALLRHPDVYLNLKNKPSFFFSPGITTDNIHNYAWFENNRFDHLASIAELKPTIIQDHKFFDVYGNAGIWLHTTTFRDLPRSPNKVKFYVQAFDASYATKPGEESFGLKRLGPNDRWPKFSFRLVRSLPK